MLEWIRITLTAVAAIVVVTALLVLLIWRCCCYNKPRKDFGADDHANQTRTESLQEGVSRLHQGSLHHQLDIDSKKRGNYYVFRRGVSTKPLFNWADHPALITDAVEHGWSRFGFTGYMSSSPTTRSMSLLGLCSVADYGRETETETAWEVCQGSADFMQKIRLNSGLKVVNIGNNPTSAATVIRTALPLPGPPLGNSAFPQEAYFEITVQYSPQDDHKSVGKNKEGEKTKLIQENLNTQANSESLVHVTSSNKPITIEDLLLNGKLDGKVEAVLLSIGLTAGGSLPWKLPGSYPGSIGFNSNGSVYLNGIKLVFESENEEELNRRDKVIGCGFDPREKKVFFTVDSELVHEIHCKTEEFGTPLYPTIAANTDILVLVNFGQSVFKYAPANANRTANPCFIGPLVNSPAAALCYEDSKELFSMGRIDSQWLNRSTVKGSLNSTTNSRGMEFDEESEADLFEIVLEKGARSPNTVL
ncbi:SPRY domain-containing protein [Cephalotus follicularis]|uniref:SPRY domain-containing protein n=1 Tax=Cephalotus follicularis TaxID=3775 RepID=A0A1Q3D9E4_CEPFO|nr:SPRY domain-containing protein [Cephalotus follicularis]